MSSGLLIDVCQNLPGIQIKCLQVSADGYDETNLISKDLHKKQMGFMAASFIKPPVEIDLTFPCITHLSHIVIGTSVGNQKTNGFEFTTADNILLGRTPYRNKFNTDKICFINRAFRTRHYFNHNNIEFPSEATRLYIRAPTGMQRLCIHNLRIRILSTEGSSVPCLGSLQVWGVPSMETSHLSADIEQEIEVIKEVKSPCPLGPITVTNSISSDPDPSEIPEEFLDSLTYEMMALPVLLPSGNTVDQSSIERHLKTEGLRGRCPSDPFTGIPLGPGYAPVPNAPLKARIDWFLLTHGANLQVPRTVGGSSSKRNVSRLLGEKPAIDSGKRSLDDLGIQNKMVKRVSPVVESSSVPTFGSGSNSGSHEDELKESLDSALSMALNNLKSYTETDRVEVRVVQCCECLKVTGNMYRLRCLHVLCSSCMRLKLSSVHILCSQCHLPFTSADPCKIHVI